MLERLSAAKDPLDITGWPHGNVHYAKTVKSIKHLMEALRQHAVRGGSLPLGVNPRVRSN